MALLLSLRQGWIAGLHVTIAFSSLVSRRGYQNSKHDNIINDIVISIRTNCYATTILLRVGTYNSIVEEKKKKWADKTFYDEIAAAAAKTVLHCAIFCGKIQRRKKQFRFDRSFSSFAPLGAECRRK